MKRVADQNFGLPWQFELALFIVGLACVPIGVWWFTNEITSPATMLGQILQVPVDIQKFVEPYRPMIWIFGIIVGWRVRCWLRRAFIRRLNRIL